MKITWAPRAKRRAEEYGKFIAQDNEEVAFAWLVGIFEPDVREIFYKSHRIIYKIGSRRIRIVTIRHGRQLLDKKEIK